MSDTKKCPYCEKEIKAISLKCDHCGKSLLEDSSSGEMATSLYWDGLSGKQTQLSDIPVESITDPFEKIKSIFSAKYEILEEVGRGGMAIVYKAIQRNLNREVALKVLPQQFVHDEEYIIRFHREANEVAKMNHPNIVTIYDEGEIDGHHYLAMEFLEGKDLHDILKEKGKLSENEVENIIAPIADALDYVHSKGLVHRDIKSSNIFVLKNGRSVLTDFGIAKTAGKTKLTQVGSIIGTPEYMSPEQADSLEIDGRGDLYSLAVVMYEALTGSVPFKADNPITLIRKIIDEAPVSARKINPDISKGMDDIILKCLEKSPDKRIQSGLHLAKSIHERKVIIGTKTKNDITETVKIDNTKTQKISSAQLASLEKQSSNDGKGKSKKGIIGALAAIIIAAALAGFYFFVYNTTSTTENFGTDNQMNQSTTIQNVTPQNSNILPDSSVTKDTTITTANTEPSRTNITEQKPVETKPTQAEIQEKERQNKLILQRKLLETKLAQSQLEEKDTKRKYEHAQKMRERNLISPSDFNKAKDAYENAQQEVRRLEIELRNLK